MNRTDRFPAYSALRTHSSGSFPCRRARQCIESVLRVQALVGVVAPQISRAGVFAPDPPSQPVEHTFPKPSPDWQTRVIRDVARQRFEVVFLPRQFSSTMRLLKSSRLASAGALDRSAVKSASIIVGAECAPLLPALKPKSGWRSPRLPGQSARPALDLVFICQIKAENGCQQQADRNADASPPLERVKRQRLRDEILTSANPCVQEAFAQLK